MGGVPSKPGDPSRPLEVISAGYSKTGTLSMQHALQKLLQGPVVHGGTQSLFPGDDYVEKYVQAYEAKAAGDREKVLKLLRELTTGYVAVADMPNIDFIPELVEIYPDVKVVLVTRDPSRWWETFAETLSYCELWFLPVLTAPVPGLRWFPTMMKLWRRNLQRLLDKNEMLAGPDIIQKHDEMVKKAVAPERLMVMSLEEARWEPLCEFLGKPVPEQPFPRVNESAAIRKKAMGVLGKCLLAWTAWASAGIGSAYLLRRLLKG